MTRPTHAGTWHADTPEMQEVDARTMRRSRIVVDEPGATQSCGDISIPLAAGEISATTHDLQTLGALLLGAQAPIPSTDVALDCTLFKSVGVAVQDVATAAAAVRQATKLGIGAQASM